MAEKLIHNPNLDPSRDIAILNLTPIIVGVEGHKYLAEVKDATSEVPYTLFLKLMARRKNALEQQRQWQDLKDLGINVPERAWAHEFDNDIQAFLATDLSENGRKLVLSCNNPELKTPSAKEPSDQFLQ